MTQRGSGARTRQLPGGGRGVEVPPERLAGWFDRFAAGHGGARTTTLAPRRVTVHAVDGSVAAVDVPFADLAVAAGEVSGVAVDALVEHMTRSRRIGVLLVRLGAHSVGIAQDGRVEHSSTDRPLVHGRNKAGGWSQQRFARRREEQSRRSLRHAADAAARVLLPERDRLDALVLGGDRSALDSLREDQRLTALLASAEQRVLDVPEPRRSVLDLAARRALCVEIEVHDPPGAAL